MYRQSRLALTVPRAQSPTTRSAPWRNPGRNWPRSLLALAWLDVRLDQCAARRWCRLSACSARAGAAGSPRRRSMPVPATARASAPTARADVRLRLRRGAGLGEVAIKVIWAEGGHSANRTSAMPHGDIQATTLGDRHARYKRSGTSPASTATQELKRRHQTTRAGEICRAGFRSGCNWSSLARGFELIESVVLSYEEDDRDYYDQYKKAKNDDGCRVHSMCLSPNADVCLRRHLHCQLPDDR